MSDDTRLLVKLVILDQDRRILLNCTNTSAQLPEIEIPRFTRTAYGVTRAAQESLGLHLFHILGVSMPLEDGDKITTTELIAVCRLRTPEASIPGNLKWCQQTTRLLTWADDFLLRTALDNFALYDSGAKTSSFGRYAALDELRAWYTPVLASLGVRETSLEQWTGDPWFALFRVNVETVDPGVQEKPQALWFKAVGEPNTREYAVTQALVEECPYWFPKIVATAPQWNGWMMEEIPGHELDEEPDERPWALTARILAKVQKRFVGQDDRLLALGCRDWRLPRVLQSLDPFFEHIEEVMQRQTGQIEHILDRGELRQLNIRCKELCHRVEDADIPYSIAHGDFSPCNVIVTDDGWPKLIDWAEAYVGFPFISWEYFWNRMVKDHPEHTGWHERMHRNYAYRVWEPLLTRNRVNVGLTLSPSMAVLILAMYCMNDPVEHRNQQGDSVKRSLVRRLNRELDILDQLVSKKVGAL